MTFPGRSILSGALIVSCLSQISAAGRADGYTHGQPMPVTCLSRTIDSGEHITDDLGKLQFTPFPTCKETSAPLALRYGVSESVNCTIDALPDELYHLFEYYVHSDVPMTCRVPTAPISPSGSTPDSKAEDQESDEEESNKSDNTNKISVLDDEGPPYTPITFAIQGTLQKSHLHIWTDMNVLAHNIPQLPTVKTKKGDTKQGYVVAGTAYSVPEFEFSLLQGKGKGKDVEKKSTEEKEASAVAEGAREPWTAGHGTKVVRGEPLTFTFHVSWIEGGQGIGWPGRDVSSSSGFGWFFSKFIFFGFAASIGGLVALYWDRNGYGGRRHGRKGDGILGVPTPGKGAVGVSFGNGGKAGNGYGGYSAGGLGKRILEQVPPPPDPQVLLQLTSSNMILLLYRLRPHIVLVKKKVQPPKRGLQIMPAFRRNRHLASKLRAKLEVNFAAVLSRDGALVSGVGEGSVTGGTGGEQRRFTAFRGLAVLAGRSEVYMSSITVATIPRMSREILSAALLSTPTPSNLAIIDVRDSDHVGGHILSSTWVPSATLDYRIAELVRTLQDKEKVVFHCALSQQRGPSAALRYARERERMLGVEESHKQEVFVLEGGFVQWQEKYGNDVRLTEAYVEDIWQEY
ncbi:hypothetical protein BJX76DRAFT_367687 [Aspergillus varians]